MNWRSTGRLFPFQCQIPDPLGRPGRRKIKFSVAEQIRAGWSSTAFVAVVEIRLRDKAEHLQVHTFYPKHTKPEIQHLLKSVRADD